MQALRFHFSSRKEIKIIMIVVNIFAILSAVLYFTGKISPVAFLMSSVLWFSLMIAFWFVLPAVIYNKAATFKDRFRVSLNDSCLSIENARGSRNWPWNDFSEYVESSGFFHLYFNSRSFFLIPKNAFPVETLHDVRLFLKEKIKK